MVTIPFLKKIEFPKFSLPFSLGPASYVGVDVGSASVKVVQLRKDRERAILETYGELKSGRYFREEGLGARGGLLRHLDQNVAELLTDVMREANVTARRVVFSIPSASSFVTVVSLPLLSRDELRAAIPYEAQRYVPIPVGEVALDWQIIEEDPQARRVSILLAAVPKEVVSKYQRIADSLKLTLEAVEIESFAAARALLAADRGVTALIQWGALVTILTIVEERVIRMNHNFGRGSREITVALARSLSISEERAETIKREVGLSTKPEERGVAEVIAPQVDSILSDLERMMIVYNRQAKRKVEKIVMTGGGANLVGLVDHVARRFGLETTTGNPFARTVYPAFLQPLLKEIGPTFAVAVGLALRQITPT
ncbi:MAG: hypothetical protein A3B37_01665 [Candidatus Sungbacteria bacterium RIFCSPLOWO2_01_FULL_59_16]|uniref:SHS2 domain-containing protein n=1 Tax=Candidatus Sungbacteria bacterium RIFCSPLOWO2_01_FULL_59_16 TaxID=1802280 RepID=A0A1G2L9T4_9BACT|nr:MAG: hypothetical protein A3B37_01665 [Candidatus Sungbacteria bacterium RIFCSPLOWO2_01_FULL_59_16]